MSTDLNRRALLKAVLAGAAGAGLPWFPERAEGSATKTTAKPAMLAVARDGSPEGMVRAAMNALGGMRKFVGHGEVVVVKPNIAWDRTPEQGANTHPDVVKTVVKMCLESGAKQVKVLDRPCNDPRRCYKRSGIQDAVLSLGDPAAVVEYVDDRRFVAVPSKSHSGASWLFYKDALDADKVINVPIAKHHSATRLTMALKNIMGLVGGNRGNVHRDLDVNIADLNTLFRFHLVILDAVRILTANGPQGGRINDVKHLNTVVAGIDPVAIDSFGATLFGITGADVPHVVLSAKRGLGEIDLRNVKISNVSAG